MVKTIFCRYSTLLIIVAVVAFAAGCDFRKPIKVGFSGQLTGSHANMGVNGRDGVLLAIDEINTAGGIAGRRVELLIRDDKGTTEGARAADQELIDTGVVAIIGHMTSSQTMAALPGVDKAGMVLLSPTTSTPALTGKVDHFFRVMADSSIQARMLARNTVHGVGLERMAAIYDKDNAAYSNAFLKTFRDELEKSGGQIVGEVGYSSAEKPVFGPLVDKLRKADPQGLLIIASARDSGLIAQQPCLLGWQTKLFGCGWARSAPLIENGGKSVEGMEFTHYHDSDSQAPDFLKFQQNFEARYQRKANFMASHAYEAMLVLAAALEKTGGRAEGLAQALPGIRIKGLLDTISLDKYGDIVRAFYRIIVQDGRFATKGPLGQ